MILKYWHNYWIWVRYMNNELRQLLNEYNWDDGFDLPKELLKNPNCDLALALEIFYLADGYSYLIDKSNNTSLKEWKFFVEKLYADILEGKYIQTESTFENPLTKVQRYKLKMQQVPDIFLLDL